MRTGGARLTLVAFAVFATASVVAPRALAGAGTEKKRARVVVLDDGEKVARDVASPMDPGPWPAGTIDLFALRGESLAIQVVVEAGDTAVGDVRTIVEPFVAADGARLVADVSTFVERFVVVERPSGNEREPGSLAFTAKSAPRRSFVGAIADALVPSAYETARAEPHQRAAVWIDIDVPGAAPSGTYRSALLVRDARGELAARDVELRVIDAALPFAATKAFAYYDTRELTRRMGDARAEPQLRELFRAHRLDAVHDVDAAALKDDRAIALERTSLAAGASVLVLGAYGSLGEPSGASLDVARRLMRAIAPPPAAASFLYAVDEDCASDWPARWRALVQGDPELRGLRVGATCGDDAVDQAADLVMQAAFDFDPARARVAEEARGKWVWAYNGRRPSAGPMMLDVPATDLRANAWIAMRYGVARWFYWESTFWFDDNRGGRGAPVEGADLSAEGALRFDPFVVAETFHNADGDYANGDGILVYPGTQRSPGMVDYGVATVFPSVRLKNLRRGIEDAGYIALARDVDRARADAVVRRMIPRALAFAGERVAWPDRARAWLDARGELAAILAEHPVSQDATGVRVSESCSIVESSVGVASAGGPGALFILCILACRAGATTARRRKSERSANHGDQTSA